MQLDTGQCHPHVGRDDAADADGERSLQHHDPLCALQRIPHRFERERSERGDAQHADLHPGSPELVDSVLDRAQHRAERDDDGVRILGPVMPDQAAGVPAELAGEGRGHLGDQPQRLVLPGVRQVAHLGERFRTDHRADRHRVVRIQHLPRLVAGQERIHLLLRRDLQPLVRVRQDEPVHAHHDRQRHFLGDPEGLDVQV